MLLTLTGHDTTAYVVFVSGPLVSTAVGAILGARVKAVGATAQQAVDQTNGSLTNRLDNIAAVAVANHVALTGVMPAAPTTPPAQ